VPFLIKTGHDIRVEGHTDNSIIRGSKYRDHWALSLARARNVLNIMLNVGIQPRRLSLVGKGASSPKRSNKKASGRRINRRVEIVILNPS